MEFLSRTLRVARKRLAFALGVSSLVSLIGAAGCALIFCGLLRFSLGFPPVRLRLLLFAVALVFGGAAFLILKLTPSLKQTAIILDRRGRTKDRFQTALSFSNAEPDTAMETAAIAECLGWLKKVDIRPLTPILPSRRNWPVVAPLVALVLLQWQFVLWHQPPVLDEQLTDLVSDQSKSLVQIASQLEQAKSDMATPDMEELIQKLREASKRLAQERQSNEEIRKSAMREFSSLEALLKQMMRTPEASPEELKALAEALKQMGENEAAKDLEEGKFDEAAGKLEQLAKQLGEGSEKTRQQLAQSMSEALDRLSEGQKKEVAEQMKQMAEAAAAQNDPEVKKAMEKLQKLMSELAQSNKDKQQQGQKQQQQQQQGGQNGQAQQQPMTADALNQLIQALEKMKQQLQEGQSPDQDSSSKITLQMPGKNGDNQGPPGEGMGDGPPSGQPGSEMDQGTTATPFGAQGAKLDETGPAKRLTGVMGEGETLRELVGTAGDDSNSKRRYKEIYQAMASDAESTVTQETIPLGSRVLIRRYFESIRPKE